MEFKSQIATTREQSIKLLSFGLKPETADMVYHYTKSRVKSFEWELQPKTPTLRWKFWTPERISKLSSPFHKHADGTPMTGEENFDELWGKDIQKGNTKKPILVKFDNGLFNLFKDIRDLKGIEDKAPIFAYIEDLLPNKED